MELLQLYYFQKLANCEHVTDAARELHIAQPALSQTIRRLERELGVALFDRTKKHIYLNDYGRVFLKYVNRALSDLDSARAEIADLSQQREQSVALSVQAASCLLPDIICKFRQLYPQIQYNILQASGTLETQENIDLTLRASLNAETHDSSTTLLEETLVAALPGSHPLAGQSTIALSQLADQPFISLSKDTNLYEALIHYCQTAGFTPQIALFCNNPATFRELLGLNMGISLIPALTWSIPAGSDIVIRPIADMDCTRYINLSWQQDRYLNINAQLMKQFLIEYFSKL